AGWLSCAGDVSARCSLRIEGVPAMNKPIGDGRPHPSRKPAGVARSPNVASDDAVSAVPTVLGKTRVGIVGTGFIVRGAIDVISADPSLAITRVLTRRPIDSVQDIPGDRLTQSIDELIEHADVIFAASGDPIHATNVVEKAMAAHKRVVTMNSEFHVTTGSYFHGRGYLTEAEGDQPGAMALLQREALGMA